MNRTPDLLITNELLYRLSYTGFAQNFSSIACCTQRYRNANAGSFLATATFFSVT